MDGMIERYQIYVDGAWRDPHGTATIDVIDPATEQLVGRVPSPDTSDVDRAVEAARRAFDDGDWPAWSNAARADLLDAIATAIDARTEELAATITMEMGSPITASRTRQVPPAAGILRQYAELARGIGPERRAHPIGTSLVVREPVGVVGAIVPWNVPLVMCIVKLAPALAAGCCVVLKPAPQAPLSPYLLAELLHDVGVPPGVVNVLAGDGEAGRHLASHPGVDKVAFTGSTAAGRDVLRSCADRIARVSLELGGKSAAVVLDDADLATVIPRLVPMAMAYSGQACHAQTRVVVPQHRHDEVVDALTASVATLRVGDPNDVATDLGPLVTAVQRDRVEGYIGLGIDEGARVATGGRRPPALPRGWFVEPTVLAHVDNTMRVAREEIFGPVVCVIPARSEQEAVRIANDSPYGLTGSVWSADPERALAVAGRIRTGAISINGRLQSPTAPFGGFKASGLGREAGPEGLAGYQELKAISLDV